MARDLQPAQTRAFSTSTRNVNNRLGNDAQVYLAIAAERIDPFGAELYRYLNFDQIEGFEDQGRVVSAEEEAKTMTGCTSGQTQAP